MNMTPSLRPQADVTILEKPRVSATHFITARALGKTSARTADKPLILLFLTGSTDLNIS